MGLHEWQAHSVRLTEVLGLDTQPVALFRTETDSAPPADSDVRICRAIIDAAAGQPRCIHRKNNACFGAVWHLGFHRIEDPQMLKMIKKFVVEGEKLFSSYDALETLISQMGAIPDSARVCFNLYPLPTTPTEPELVLILCNPEQACRLLTLITFVDGVMPAIKIGGPTCRMAVVYPLLEKQANISFYDYTARKICHLDKDKLLVSIPAAQFPQVVSAIEHCTAGTAKIEYPQDFKEFLQKRQRNKTTACAG